MENSLTTTTKTVIQVQKVEMYIFLNINYIQKWKYINKGFTWAGKSLSW